MTEYLYAHYVCIEHSFLLHIPVELFALKNTNMRTYPLLPCIFISYNYFV